MVETCVGPSELHLKKELTALQKARFLRDPETCTSCRSPVSYSPFAVATNLNDRNETTENQNVVNSSDGSFEVPKGIEKRRKKVYLYNWGHQSSKSSDSGVKDSRHGSVQGSQEDISSNTSKFDSRSDTYLEDPVTLYGNGGMYPEIPVRKTVRKSRRRVTVRKRVNKNPANSKMSGLQCSSLGLLNSVGQSDDVRYFSSDDSRQSKNNLDQKICFPSHSPLPFCSMSDGGNWSNTSKILKNTRRAVSSYSCSPASNRYGGWNPRNVRSWDGTRASSDGDEEDLLDLRRNQGCSFPCYWPKRTKELGYRSCSSPSLSDTSRRKVTSILCGSRTLYNKRRSSGSQKHKYLPNSPQGLPLLSNSFDRGGSSADTTSDELSSNFGELDLEASSRLDGRRWSNCKSSEGLELALSRGTHRENLEQRSLSQKHRPMSFDEIVGHNLVVQSLSNAILRGRVAPAYLFQGSRGTGKTSTARVFAAALNCLSTEENKPCRLCSECINFTNGKDLNMREVDATNKKDVGTIQLLLKNIPAGTTLTQYKIFLIDECHMLSSKSWSAFMKFLEEPLPHVVFIFITIRPDKLPRVVVSRCQKYLFPKIKDADIVCRLTKISAKEKLDIESEAIDLIAMSSDGSLRDAETMLDQLSLQGRRITAGLVNDLVGLIPDEKLLDLLETALSSDSVETVKRSRELLKSGVDPVALMTQLAGLIMDIIAGTYPLANLKCSGKVLYGRSFEIERLQEALKILSDAEKQLRFSSERSTWFTAALLQLGSSCSPQLTPSSSSSKQISEKSNEDVFEKAKESSFVGKSDHSVMFWESSSAIIPRITSVNHNPYDRQSHSMSVREKFASYLLSTNIISANTSLFDTAHKSDATSKRVLRCVRPDKLEEIWRRCIERCDSETLRQLLHAHGKLLSITEIEGAFIVYIAFGDQKLISRAEGFLNSITDSIANVLKHNVEIKIGLMPEKYLKALSLSNSLSSQHTEMLQILDKVRKVESDRIDGSSYKDQHIRLSSLPRSVDYSQNTVQKALDRLDTSSIQWPSTTANDEQRLENAWLQAAEKGGPRLVSHSKPVRNHALLENGAGIQNQNKSSKSHSLSLEHWENGVTNEIEELETNHSQGNPMKQAGCRCVHHHHPISPSLLHSDSFRANLDKDILGYESGSAPSGLCCWETSKHQRGKGKQGNHVRSKRASRFLCFGQSGKSKGSR